MIKINAEKYIGMTNAMNCGMKATIIAYRNYNDIDVRFENGIISKHRTIGNFTAGRISKTPRFKNTKDKYIGQTRTMNCGLKATIIAYRRSSDIDVRFENGIIIKHKRVGDFNKDSINPNEYHKDANIIGQTKTMNCGMKATIIEYRNHADIDIEFENGSIRRHIDMSRFNRGQILPRKKKTKDDYIGMSRHMNCGMKATVIAYRTSHDADIQFEDGTIRQHVSLTNFNQGTIGKVSHLTKADWLNSTNIMNCGMKATIIAYRKSCDIDVQFEDGIIRRHMTISNFNKGIISHPTNMIFDKYKLDKIAFAFHNKTYFYVTYTENDSEITDIMCVDDMKQKLPAST